MENFNKEIKEIANHYGRQPIFDGIVNEQEYVDSNIKILWILKEPNSTGESEAWDMREHINTKLKTKSGILKGWSRTFKKIIYVTNGILNNLSWNEDLHHPSYNPKVIDELKKMAYINIKKTGGLASAQKSEIKSYYEYSKSLLLRQIDVFNPNIIIFGGTYSFFQKDLNPNNFEDFGSCKAALLKNRLLVDAYHPAYFKITEENYFNDILNAINKLSK